MFPLTIDFEASCLPRDGRSFPIEVGIADGFAETSRSWLIKPHDDWNGWTWTREAEGLHGISREKLEQEGLPAAVVMNDLNIFLGDRQVIADNWLDAAWLETLSEAAGIAPTFTIAHVANVLDDMSPAPEQIVHADQTVAIARFRRHRAGEDARHLAMWLAALSQTPQSAKPARHDRATGQDAASA